MPLTDPSRRLRQATLEDAMSIAEVHVRSWKAAYPGLIPQDYLDSLSADDRLGGWQQALTSEPWPVVLVLEEGRTLSGFVCLSPSRDTDADDKVTGEIQAIYLDPHVFGRGAGQLLMSAAEAELAAAGFREATLWVLDTNERARRFYERLGWRHDGTDKFHDWTAFTATDLRYSKSLR